MKRYSFRKAERLCSRKAIGQLFAAIHETAREYPVLAIYRRVERADGQEPVQLLLSVSKRRFKHAVDRNRAKRLLREAYRLNRALLPADRLRGAGIDVAFVWLSNRPLPYERVCAAVQSVLRQMAEALQREATPPAE